ncbi:MAG: hypothetical protein JXR47_05530 [Thiotrichales bacterium]|nr:hypothetical protein [Thiotrichales bacterium]
MFGLTSGFKSPYLFKKRACDRTKPVSKEPDFSRLALDVLTGVSFEQAFLEMLSDPALQFYFRSTINPFCQLFIVNNQLKLTAQKHDMLSEGLRTVLLSQYSEHEHDFAFQDNAGKRYVFYGFPVWSEQKQLLGNVFVACFKPVSDCEQFTSAFKPFLVAVGKILEVQAVKHQQLERAIENERKEFAADLHDTVAQVLSYLNFKTSSLKNLCEAKGNHLRLKTNIQDIHQQVIYANRLTRELIGSSRVQLSCHPVSRAIQLIVDEYELLSSIVFEIDNRCQSEVDSLGSANEIIYVVRESITNLVRHSHASHARILVRKSADNMVLLRIEDNGIGIDKTAKRKDSFGLKIMQERMHKAGALLEVEPRQGGGTQVSIFLPLQQPSFSVGL